MAKKIKTRPVTMIQVREYLAKAEEFLLAATSELEAGQDHRETISLLGQAGDGGSQLAKDLQRMLPLKTTAEYEPNGIPLSKAKGVVERAKRCVDVAHRVVGSLSSPSRADYPRTP